MKAWIFLLFFLFTSFSEGKVIGKFGKTYQIAEPDFLEEVEQRLKSVDWSKVFDPQKLEKKIREFRPPNLVKLALAKENRIRYHKIIHTLEFDITDEKGKVIYPKGYTFNPLDYVVLPNSIVVVNGTKESHIKFLKEYLKKDPYAIILITDGSAMELTRKLKTYVFYATRDVIEVLNVKRVPSVVTQKENYLVIREVKIDERR